MHSYLTPPPRVTTGFALFDTGAVSHARQLSSANVAGLGCERKAAHGISETEEEEQNLRCFIGNFYIAYMVKLSFSYIRFQKY